MDNKAKAEELKVKGNAVMKSNIDEAIRLYTEAIGLDESNHVLYSNRSAAYAKCAQYSDALNDAEQAITLKKDWPKGYSRKGAALSYLGRYEEASLAYEDGLRLDPNNQQMKEGLMEAKKHLIGPAGSQPLRNPFMDPNLRNKLEDDPRTKDFLKQTDFVKILDLLKQDPKNLGNYLQDPRVMTSLSVLLGVNLESATESNEEEMPPQPPPQPATPSTTNSASARSDKKTNIQKDEPMEQDLNSSEKQALKEKEEGNAAYKKKNFEVAIQHYDKAIELDDKNIVFRSNKAAVLFEQQEYDKCIEECTKAVEIGRENRADYKLIAKALARIGNAYHKKDDLKNAVTFYNKSLSEHRAPEVVKKAAEIERLIKEQERQAYLNPDISLEEKNKGNEYFQKGDYPGAVKHYNEAVRRNPKDAKVFSNRAACYMKLMEFSMALKDCEEAIKLDPNFVKGYLRKGACLLAMKSTTKAGEAYQKAMELDPNCQEAIDGYRNSVYANNDPEAVKQHAMSDPEVQQILADPAMQLILQQMQKDPKALQEHLKNPDIAAKIQKLMESGLIAIR